MRHAHDMPFGARLPPGGGAQFRLWAPSQAGVTLEWSPDGTAWQPHAMTRAPDGWHALTLPDARAGGRYRYRLPDGLAIPDPASRRNPSGVHEASELLDPLTYEWCDAAWRGRPWYEAVVYELHVGTFTPEGSFDAVRARLPELAALGFTAVELMPVAAFPGRRGWGYDGVLQFAPHAAYGTPDALKALVDAAHGLGLMVLLDVVYNHFGPEGNYLHPACPEFFNAAHHTPWGAAINYDAADARTVRDFFVHNALYWIEEYRFDGLRMDAVHAIRDDSQPDIVEEVCAALRHGPGRERAVHVVLENDDNHAYRLGRDAAGVPAYATAQWNDDLHHAAHVLLTGETDGYYVDFAQQPARLFAQALSQGFIYIGQPSPFRDGSPRGEPSDALPPTAFVSYLQTHDQIGNRAFGERIDALADPARLAAARACLLLSPHVPMLFMGEEYAATTPFLYFCDFGPELAQAVAAGRREEFGRFAAFSGKGAEAAAARARISAPNDEQPFVDSTLRWEDRLRPPHAVALAHVRALLALRAAELVPRWAGGARCEAWSCSDAGLIGLRWRLADAAGRGHRLHLLANFGASETHAALPRGRVLHAAGGHVDAGTVLLAPAAVWAMLEEPALG